MNHLLRSLAPISESGWRQLDEEARERLVPALAARRLVDFSGPHGWEHSAANLGRATALGGAPCDGVTATQRRVLPLVELRAPFSISIHELRDLDRGAPDADLSELDAAAHRLAVAENKAVFHGFGEAAIVGIADASPQEGMSLGDRADDYPRPVAAAVQRLLGAGISGPYALALGSEQYQLVAQTAEHGGYPLLDHLHEILDGPIVWTPGVSGAVVLSTRGSDFLFDCGQDISVGFESFNGELVRLYLEESFAFHVATPEAAVALVA
jgi:uncharacterized linocin/CFP29 family protein